MKIVPDDEIELYEESSTSPFVEFIAVFAEPELCWVAVLIINSVLEELTALTEEGDSNKSEPLTLDGIAELGIGLCSLIVDW